jgi:hypothetical protein
MQAMYYLIAKMRWGTQRRERSVMISRKKRTAMISRDVSVGAKCTVNNGATLLYVPSHETFASLCKFRPGQLSLRPEAQGSPGGRHRLSTSQAVLSNDRNWPDSPTGPRSTCADRNVWPSPINSRLESGQSHEFDSSVGRRETKFVSKSLTMLERQSQ